MTYTIGDGPTRQQPADFDEWYKASDFVDDVEHSFDPEKGIISGSADFTFFNVLGIKDFFGREPAWADPDHRPPVSPSQNKFPGGLDPSEKIWESLKLMKEKTPDLVQPITYTVTWNLNLDKGACHRTVRIINPKENEEVYFGDPKTLPGTLNITGHAEADPKSYGPHIYPWDIDDIKGSTKEIKQLSSDCQSEYDSTPVEGECVRFRFKGLPEDNAQFGKKAIYADTAEPVHIKVFFRKAGKDNPGNSKFNFGNPEPNWFYYWMQGAVPRLDEFVYSDSPPAPNWAAAFEGPDLLVVFTGAALCTEPRIIELFERFPGFVNPESQKGPPGTGQAQLKSMKENAMIRVFRTIYIPELKGVDKCHACVLHELKHKWVYDSFFNAIAGGQADSDGDGLPDIWEIYTQSVYQFDPKAADTHFLKLQGVAWDDWSGDQEVLAREAELRHAAVHELDWARPGKQSEDKDECNAKK